MGRAADYGESTPVLLASWHRASSSWRTFQHSLFGGLSRYSETLPRSGMMRNGMLYQRETWARGMTETGYGLLPTPCARDWKDCGAPAEYARKSPTLAALTLLPTPRASRGYTAYGNEGFAPSLTEAVTGLAGRANNGLKPNPSFVEWLMGYPIGWGVLARSATPSPRKSRK